MPLTSRAKALMGVQATAALITSVLVIARAVGRASAAGNAAGTAHCRAGERPQAPAPGSNGWTDRHRLVSSAKAAH